MNFREFLQLIEASPMKSGPAPNKPGKATMTQAARPSEFGGGGPTKDSPTGPTARPPGVGNYDYPVKPRSVASIPVTTLDASKIKPSPFGSGGPTPETPKVPPPPVPKQMMNKKMKKK